jgi:GNAT superfamily N-acetyltransferase
MWWKRTRSEFERHKGDANKEALRAIVESGRTPGLLAYIKGTPIGWCAIEPRNAYPALERSRTLKPVDDQPVWSVTCFFVARRYRRRGVTVALLRAASVYATEQGAQIVEGYPVEPRTERMPDAFAWTGTAAAFRAAGFEEVLRRSETRPIMRYMAPSTPKS